jgi:predicted secreted protein
MFTFTEADNGKTGDITLNTRFAIELPENPTTGFTWNATLSPGLGLRSSDYRQNPATAGMAGAGGTRLWIITAQDPGEHTFSAAYRRPWEAATGTGRFYRVTVRVARA